MLRPPRCSRQLGSASHGAVAQQQQSPHAGYQLPCCLQRSALRPAPMLHRCRAWLHRSPSAAPVHAPLLSAPVAALWPAAGSCQRQLRPAWAPVPGGGRSPAGICSTGAGSTSPSKLRPRPPAAAAAPHLHQNVAALAGLPVEAVHPLDGRLRRHGCRRCLARSLQLRTHGKAGMRWTGRQAGWACAAPGRASLTQCSPQSRAAPPRICARLPPGVVSARRSTIACRGSLKSRRLQRAAAVPDCLDDPCTHLLSRGLVGQALILCHGGADLQRATLGPAAAAGAGRQQVRVGATEWRRRAQAAPAAPLLLAPPYSSRLPVLPASAGEGSLRAGTRGGAR